MRVFFNALEVILPNPEFQDELSIDPGLKLKRMMDGSKWSFIRTPVTSVYTLRFQNMNRNKIEETRLFLIATAGKRINMEDQDGNLWKGHILNNPTTFTHVAVRNNQFDIQFEGHIFE